MYYDYFTFPFWADVFLGMGFIANFVRANQQEDAIAKLVNRVRFIEPRVMKKVRKENNKAKASSGKAN